MGYIENNLGKEERVVLLGKIHWTSLVPHILLMCVAIGFITIIPALIRMFTTELGITNKRISGKTGLLNTNTMDSPLNKVQNIKVNQSLFGKLLGYGDIAITTSSGSYLYKGIGTPDTFRNALNEEIENYDEARIKRQAEQLASSINATK